MEGRPGSNRLATILRCPTLFANGQAGMPGLTPGLLCWRVYIVALACAALSLHYVSVAWCWLYIGSCHVLVGWLQAEYMLLSKGC
jgi:hypothetical protein